MRDRTPFEDLDAANREEARSTAFYDPWENPPPPEFPGGVLSREMEDTIFALAIRGGMCPGMLAMAHLAAASGAASASSRFQPYANDPTWRVPAIIWLLVLAESGQRKTAAQELAFAPLRALDAETWRRYYTRLREWQQLPAKERRNSNPPEEPTPVIAEDSTPEKLQQFLANTDRGLLYLKDEIAGLFGFGRYSTSGGGAERAFFLQAYEGSHYIPSRLSRSCVPITVNAITLYGAIQPERLKDFEGLDKDGLIQRMGFVRAGATTLSRPDVTVHNHTAITDMLTRLARTPAACFTTTPDGEAIIRQTEYDAASFATLRELGEGFPGWCHKMHGTLARYALILHMLDDTGASLIPTETLQRANYLVRDYLLPSARDFFGMLPGAAIQRTRDIAGWILASAPDRVLASDLKSSVRACRPLATRELNDALDPLVTGGWLRPDTDFPSNRVWFVSPALRQHFTDRTQAERQRRADVRRLLEQIGRTNAPRSATIS